MSQTRVFVRQVHPDHSQLLMHDCHVVTSWAHRRMRAAPKLSPVAAYQQVKDECRRLWVVDWEFIELVVEEPDLESDARGKINQQCSD